MKHVERAGSLQEAQAGLGNVAWPERKAYADAVYEATFMGWMFGHLEIATKYLQVELAAWTNLKFEEAIRIFKSKQLVSKEEYDRLSDAYKARAWTIAGDHADYTIEQVHGSLTEAISDGIGQGQWVTETAEMFDLWGVTGRGDHHLRTVYNTSTAGAYQHGRYQQMGSEEMKRRRPFWQYRTVGDERVRDSHRAMDGRIYAADDPVWSTWYPPNGFNCRCRVDPLRSAEALSDPPSATPDPGFGSAPGV